MLGTPSLRTPCCGRMDCVPPIKTTISNSTEFSQEILKNSSLSLWQSYCDKKMENEYLKDLLKEASILLTEGTEEHCKQLADRINNYLKENLK